MDWLSNINLAGVTGTSGTLQGDFAKINANLNRELEKIKHRCNKGLIEAAVAIRRDMEITPPLIPIDYGNLKASWFIKTKKSADPISKSMQVTNAKFRKAASAKILAELQSGHAEVLASADGQLAKYPIGVMIGFSAFYSAPVHEMIGDNVVWSKSGSGPKFFQAAIYRNFDKILSIVKANTLVP